VRVRGLKPSSSLMIAASSTSHPVRVRGLKLEMSLRLAGAGKVAPRAGAWVETPLPPRGAAIGFRRTPCGCVG